MEPIPVPAPPASAFNKNRRVSDLLLGQLKHFQHVEKKNGIVIDPALARDLATEAGAARYITQITRAIRSQSLAKASARPTAAKVIPIQSAKKKGRQLPTGTGLTLAASEANHPVPESSATPQTPGVTPLKPKSKTLPKGRPS